MYRLASVYSPDVAPLRSTDLPSLFSQVARLPYRRDLDEQGDAGEILRRPRYTLSAGGDCDDKTILAGAMFHEARIPWRIVTTSYLPTGEMQHVYAEVYDDRSRQWIPFDATYPTNELGVERPFTGKLTWSNPMETTRLGVVTLEGNGPLGQSSFDFLAPVQGQTPNLNSWQNLFTGILGPSTGGTPTAVTSTSLPAAGAIVGSVVPGVGTVAGTTIGEVLSILGISIKGPTQHLSYDEANNAAKAFTHNVVAFVTSLPADGRTFAYQQIQQFYKRFLAEMGGWWGGAMNALDAKWRAAGGFSTPDGELYFGLFVPAYTILQQADRTTVEQDFNKWYVEERYKPYFANPLSAYLGNKLGEVVNASPTGTFIVNPGSGGSPITSATQAGFGTLAIIGILLVAVSRFGRKR